MPGRRSPIIIIIIWWGRERERETLVCWRARSGAWLPVGGPKWLSHLLHEISVGHPRFTNPVCRGGTQVGVSGRRCNGGDLRGGGELVCTRPGARARLKFGAGETPMVNGEDSPLNSSPIFLMTTWMSCWTDVPGLLRPCSLRVSIHFSLNDSHPSLLLGSGNSTDVTRSRTQGVGVGRG